MTFHEYRVELSGKVLNVVTYTMQAGISPITSRRTSLKHPDGKLEQYIVTAE